MSKKILSLALAVIMLFSVCAVAVSAVDGDGTEEISLVISSDATVGAPAGTVVKVSYYVDLPVDELQMCVGNIAIGYNSAAYKVNSDETTNAADARTWGDDFGQYMKSTSAVTVSTAISNNIVKKFNANDTAKGWDKALQVQMVYDGTNASSSTGFPVADMQHIFTLEFVAQRELTAADVIGVVEGAYSSSFFKVCYFDGTKIGTYDVANIDMTQAAAVAPAVAAKADVYKLADPRKHVNADGTSTVAAFFAFDAATIAPDFNTAGTSQFITGITATITATSGGQTITVTPDAIKYVYDINSDGSVYGFRVIMKNVPADAEITIVPAVATTNNATYTVDTLDITVANVTAY